MLIVDMSVVKLPRVAQQNNLPPECGQPIGAGAFKPKVIKSRVVKLCLPSPYTAGTTKVVAGLQHRRPEIVPQTLNHTVKMAYAAS
jgi:hypothetical protein